MRTFVASLALLLILSPVAESATTVRRRYTPHFPSTRTTTITRGKLNYIRPTAPKTR